jgi:hypothetical protein
MRLSSLSGGALVFCLVALAVACGGDDDKDNAPLSCTGNADCISSNPCQVGTCGDNDLCTFEAASDGPAPLDVEGDCRRAYCTDGRPEYTPDDSDVADDDEACTDDYCDDGVPRHTVSANGSSCSVGNGSGVCTQGTCLILCVAANAASQCDDDDPCTEDLCVPCDAEACRGLGQCDHAPGNGAGPDDFNDCTIDYCEEGTPIHEPAPAATPCASGGSVCNAAGDCVQCVADEDCAGMDVSTCYVPVCDNGLCDEELAPDGTVPETADTPGDCHRPICSGTGSVTTEVYDDDVPDDMNPCTVESCLDGNPVYESLDPGASCGDSGEICSNYAECCTPFVHDAEADTVVALRLAYTSVYTRTAQIAAFDVAGGSSVDLATVDDGVEQIIHDPVSGQVFYVTSFDFGVLADCNDTELTGITLTPDTTTTLSNPTTVALDTSADEVLVGSWDSTGILYSYDPADPDWTELGDLNGFYAVAGSYFSGDDKLYLADSSWPTTLARHTPGGVFEGAVSLSPALESTSILHTQIRESGSSLFYILYGHDSINPVYRFVAVDPTDGTSTPIFPAP